MKNTRLSMAFLACLVIISFIFCAFALGQEIFWLAALFFFSGFAFMGYGLRLKKSST